MTDQPAAADGRPDWYIFGGKGTPKHRLKRLREAVPPWRDFTKRAEILGRTYQMGPQEYQVVNAALYLRRPLLVTGPPGSGKSSLAYAVARDLGLGDVLRWPINSRSTLGEGLYGYDAIARLRDVEIEARARGQRSRDIGKYVRLNALGTVLYPSAPPRALLIDEIDKSDIDLPNDLLHVFEEGEFEIPELARIADEAGGRTVRVETADPVPPGQPRRRVPVHRGVVRCTNFPFVVLTSNGERDLPPAFFRRCLRLELPAVAAEDHLTKVVEAHLGRKDAALLKRLIGTFRDKQKAKRLMANDQLLNVVYLITTGQNLNEAQREDLERLLLRELDQ
jgi:MoxR-like ATPase